MAINDFVGDKIIDLKMRSIPSSDSIVNSVIDNFISRSMLGKNKYGTDLDRQDLSLYDWCEHMQQELMDSILYLEKIKKTIGGNKL